jgi:hypothetical protein
VHRVGRTGRAGREGTAFTFLTPDEEKFAPDIVTALEASGAPVPADVRALAEGVRKKKDQGEIQFLGGSGYGGKGFQYSETEEQRRKEARKRERAAFGQEHGLEENASSSESDAEAAGVESDTDVVLPPGSGALPVVPPPGSGVLPPGSGALPPGSGALPPGSGALPSLLPLPVPMPAAGAAAAPPLPMDARTCFRLMLNCLTFARSPRSTCCGGGGTCSCGQAQRRSGGPGTRGRHQPGGGESCGCQRVCGHTCDAAAGHDDGQGGGHGPRDGNGRRRGRDRNQRLSAARALGCHTKGVFFGGGRWPSF